MSVAVMTKVWDTSLAAEGCLLVLLAIADFADDDGRAFPSVPKLAKKARLSERQTQCALRRLEEIGELKIFKRRLDHGGWGSSAYQVLTPSAVSAPPPGAISAPAGEVGNTTLVKFATHLEDRSIPPLTATGTAPPLPPQGGNGSCLFPDLPPVKPKRTRKSTEPSEEFLQFWREYPRHKKMKDAWKAWQQANPALTVVLESLAAHKKSQDWRRGPQYIPYPATWIRAEQWDDDL